jgi:hypothetical protein
MTSFAGVQAKPSPLYSSSRGRQPAAGILGPLKSLLRGCVSSEKVALISPLVFLDEVKMNAVARRRRETEIRKCDVGSAFSRPKTWR